MDEKQKGKKFEKCKLNYRSAFKGIVPKATIPVSASHMGELDRTIKAKIKQRVNAEKSMLDKMEY